MRKKITAKNVKDKLQDDTLDLSLNDLEEVPVKEIATVKRFSHLDLSNNLLTSLPKTFATLTQIIKLDLSKNMLSEIPDNFGELRLLRHLDLYSNKISRLPLSLGNLKNLKWLDLKENPLTDAVASVAGPCSNASECQACAKNVVSFLANLQIQIEENRQMRLNSLQEMEKNQAIIKKEAKKKKKKEEKKALEKDKSSTIKKEKHQEKNNLIKPSKPTLVNEYSCKIKNSNGSVCSLLCRAFTSLIMWLAFFILLAITIIAIFPLYDEHHAEEMFKYIDTEMGVPLKQYHQESVRLVEIFIDKTKLWTNHTRDLLVQTYQEYFLEESSTDQEANF